MVQVRPSVNRGLPAGKKAEKARSIAYIGLCTVKCGGGSA